jgi:SAM-dependent methyltransferase
VGFFERQIFARFLDLAMRRMNPLREPVLAPARGDVLEIGFGTGLNLKYYPPAVRSLAAVDPLVALDERVARRIAAAPFPVERHALPADGGLPFDDARFDSVAVTWTLCTIPDPAAALREMRRVLRPDGQLLFIEHGLSRDPGIARWQRRINPVHRLLANGCNLDRATDALLDAAGFHVEQLDYFVPEGFPRIWGTMYRGVARGAT